MSGRFWMLFVLLLAVAGAALWRLDRRSAGPPSRPPVEEGAGESGLSLRCYFPTVTGYDLFEEIRVRPDPGSPLGVVRALVEELHRGPDSGAALPLFPAHTAPRVVYLTADGTAYLDEPAEAVAQPRGPRGEFLLMRAIARTLLRNCPDVTAFVVLVDGAHRHRLVTHFPAQGRYVLPRIARAPEPG